MSHYYHKSVLSISHNSAWSSAINDIFPSFQYEVKRALTPGVISSLKGSQKDFLGYSLPISVCICAQSHVHMWTLRLHGQQPTRLLCPRNFPGKNAGVVAISFSRGSSWPRDQMSLALAGRFFTTVPAGKLLSPQIWGHVKTNTGT